jgi:GTPase SAR1 family protein
MLFFSLVDEASFVYLSEMIQHIEKLREREISSFPVVLIGTKHDLVTETIISKEHIHSFMARYEIPYYFETDVRRGTNVTESFVKIGELICDSTLDLSRKQISQWEQSKKNCQIM